MSKHSPSAFRLTECLIVVAILGLLAALAAPRLSGASPESREAALQGHLLTLQSLLDLYKVQHNGLYPWENLDGSTDADQILQRMTQRTNALHQSQCSDSAFGPYLQEIPENPFVVDGQAVFGTERGVGVDWVIDLKTQTVCDGRSTSEGSEQ